MTVYSYPFNLDHIDFEDFWKHFDDVQTVDIINAVSYTHLPLPTTPYV